MNSSRIQELIVQYGDCRASGDTYHATVKARAIQQALEAPADPVGFAQTFETDPYRAWNEYARRSGLLDENGEAPDRFAAQTAFSAFAYAWNLLVREHFLRRGEIQR